MLTKSLTTMTINHALIERLLLLVTPAFIVVLLVLGKVSQHPATTSFILDLPEGLDSPSRVWVLSHPVTPEETECLALNVYFEARDQSPQAQYAVAEVVLYRVMNANFPDSICAVVKQGRYPSWNDLIPYKWKCSFTWHCDRKSDIPTDLKAFEVAKYIVNDVLNNPVYEPELTYALYYHAFWVDPYWRPSKTFVGKVGAHLFYI